MTEPTTTKPDLPIEVEVRGVKARIIPSHMRSRRGCFVVWNSDAWLLGGSGQWRSEDNQEREAVFPSLAAAKDFIGKLNAEWEREKVSDPGPQRRPASVPPGEQASPSPAESLRCPTCGHLDPLIAVDCCEGQQDSQPPQGEQPRERLTKDDPPGWYECNLRCDDNADMVVVRWSGKFLYMSSSCHHAVAVSDFIDFIGPLTLDGLAAAILEKISNWRVVANVLGGRENEIHREMYHRCASELESILEAHKIAGAGGGTPASLNTANL